MQGNKEQGRKVEIGAEGRSRKRPPLSLCKCFIFNKFNKFADVAKLTRAPLTSVQFSHSVTFDSLKAHGLWHARPPCPSPIPRVYPNSCPLSWWCHPTITSSVVPFFSYLQSFPTSGSFLMSQFSTSGGQSIGGVSASGLTDCMNWLHRSLGMTQHCQWSSCLQFPLYHFSVDDACVSNIHLWILG